MNRKTILAARLPLAIIFLACGLLAMAYYTFLLTLPGGRNLGVLLVGIHSVVFLILGLSLVLKHKALLPERIWILARTMILLFVFWLGSFALVACLIMTNNGDTALERPDYVLILGAGLDGNKPDRLLQERLETGLSYLRVNPAVPVIVSGGQGSGETSSEAQAMQNYLLQRGIASERILLEDRSQSTQENFLYTARLLEGAGVKLPADILIITSDFHIFRSRILAQRNGFLCGTKKAPTPVYLLPANLLRESFALGKSIIFDR